MVVKEGDTGWLLGWETTTTTTVPGWTRREARGMDGYNTWASWIFNDNMWVWLVVGRMMHGPGRAAVSMGGGWWWLWWMDTWVLDREGIRTDE